MIYGLIMLFILGMAYIFKPEKTKYGCDCKDKAFEFLRTEGVQRYYKCTQCGTQDHLFIYQGSYWTGWGTSINPRMKTWHVKECMKRAFNIHNA